MWMHKQPERVSINKAENTVFPEIFSMNGVINEHHHKETDIKKAAKPNMDVHHHSANHKPRQLSGRHH